MNKLILYIILVGIVSCCNKSQPVNKPIVEEQVIDTLEIIQELDSLTEECWELFDEFWVEFQECIEKNDFKKLKKMCKLPKVEYDWFIQILLEYEPRTKSLLKFMNAINKENKFVENYDSDNDYAYEGGIRLDSNCDFNMKVYFHGRSANGGTICEGPLEFTFKKSKNNKYKLTHFD